MAFAHANEWTSEGGIGLQNMKVSKVKIKNFRLLKDFEINLKDKLSVIIGKNNSGKTSFLLALEKVLGNQNKRLNFDDINKSHFSSWCEAFFNEEVLEELGLEIIVTIEYDDSDNLSSLEAFIMDLDPEKNEIEIKFSYKLNQVKLEDLKVFKSEENRLDKLERFLRKRYQDFFNISIHSVCTCDNSISKIVKGQDIRQLINLEVIHARRETKNQDEYKSRKSLSSLAKEYYDVLKQEQEEAKVRQEQEELKKNLQEVQKTLENADESFNKAYDSFFTPLYKDVADFGANKNAEIQVLSNLNLDTLFQYNTHVFYKEYGNNIPEDYNGLGYLNLIEILFRLHILFVRSTKESKAINLLFIEEPEAHTHPQMQYIFINEIKKMINSKNTDNLQTILSTHSAHIVSQSNFEDLFYFKRNNKGVVAKPFDGIFRENMKFFLKYLLLKQSELFFADKIICIEGATERILMPKMMEKIDVSSDNQGAKLSSQHISILEVGGAYFHLYDEFFKFLEIKVLIITDIDRNDKGTQTTNPTLKYFFQSKEIEKLENCDHEIKDKDYPLYIAFQNSLPPHSPTTFEDCFVIKNIDFMKKNLDKMEGIKNKDNLKNALENEDFQNFCNDYISRKTDFALDILLCEDTGWKVPTYIEEGLKWLKKNQ